jgi:hypothetical protein
MEHGAAAGQDIASAKRQVLPEIKNGRAGVWPFPPQPQAIANGLPLRGQAAGRPGRGAFTSKTIKRCAKFCCVLPQRVLCLMDRRSLGMRVGDQSQYFGDYLMLGISMRRGDHCFKPLLLSLL